MRKGETKQIANIRVGRPDVEPSASRHVRGVFQGNHPHKAQRHKGIDEVGEDFAVTDARRSTGIRPDAHDTIDPRMPKLTPA